MRYTMKNAEGEIMADIMRDQPVRFLYGSGEILPDLEGVLKGLKIGEQKNFCISPDSGGELKREFHFDVIIDDVQWATENDLNANASATDNAKESCGPEGCC